jgi:hypothetical protein
MAEAKSAGNSRPLRKSPASYGRRARPRLRLAERHLCHKLRSRCSTRNSGEPHASASAKIEIISRESNGSSSLLAQTYPRASGSLMPLNGKAPFDRRFLYYSGWIENHAVRLKPSLPATITISSTLTYFHTPPLGRVSQQKRSFTNSPQTGYSAVRLCKASSMAIKSSDASSATRAYSSPVFWPPPRKSLAASLFDKNASHYFSSSSK